MDVKTGIKNWAPSPQRSGLAVDRSQTVSATDRAALGDQPVGDLLNKVADPNYIDPDKNRKVGNTNLDKDAFMKLMLTQMKYQDPTSPMQSHEMAAQLAQFTSLEQLSNINTTLTGMSKTQSPMTNYQALNFIGKRVSGDSSKMTRVTGDTEHEFNFALVGDVAKADIKVMDGDGNVVRKLTMGALKKGQNSIKWNGMQDDGSSARPGDYHFAIEATSSSGAKIYAKTEFNGKITGLNYTPQGPVLLVGQQAIRLQDVKKIEDGDAPGAQAGQPPAMPAQMGQMIPLVPGAQNQPPPEPAKDSLTQDHMAKNVAMSRAVMEQLAKAKDNGS